MRSLAAPLAFAVVAATVVLARSATSAPAKAGGERPLREFTVLNVEYKETKFWTPSTFIVKKGEHVKMKLINKAPSGVHGFAIDEVGVKVAVNNQEKDNTQTVEFDADKPGLYRLYCHMHPAHLGGQLLILE